MDEAELLARADANYYRSWSLLTAGTPGHEIVERDGLLISAGEHVQAAFNLAFLWDSGPPLPERLAAVRDYFQQHRRPYLVRLREGAIPGAEDALTAAGLVDTREAIPGLVHEGLLPPPAAAPRVVACRTARQLTAWAKTMAAGYEMPVALAESFTARLRAGLFDYELYLGYDGRVPVAASGLVLSHRVAGVYMVATVPSHRRLGYGQAMTRHAMEQGLSLGADFSSLQSSAMGMSIYRRMGFRRVATYRTWREDPSVV